MSRWHPRNRAKAWPIPGGMNTCRTTILLWIHALGRIPLDDQAIRAAFELLDRRRFDG